jgi:hypothetical protein
MVKILVDYHITPIFFGFESPYSGSYFLCLVEICLYILHSNLVSVCSEIHTKHVNALSAEHRISEC